MWHPVDLWAQAEQPPGMSQRSMTSVTTLLVIGVITIAAPAPAARHEGSPAAVTTAYETVPLAHYWVTGTTCFTYPPSSGRLGGGCVVGDGVVRRPISLHERLKAAFGGTVTLLLPEPVDAVYVSYGRRPATEYLTPAVVSTLPGSGTYHLVVTVKWHDEFTRSETTYLVPLWVPRRR
jgi:hypothetical protein